MRRHPAVGSDEYTWRKFYDGWFEYYYNVETGEKKFKLEPGDILDKGETTMRHDTTKILIGERLTALLKDRGMTQTDLAYRIDRNPGAVNGWCQDITNPNLATTVMVADVLGVSLDYLILGKEPAKQKMTTDDKMVSVEDVLEAIRDIARYPEAELRADDLIHTLERRLMVR